jgi:hypothetical protein
VLYNISLFPLTSSIETRPKFVPFVSCAWNLFYTIQIFLFQYVLPCSSRSSLHCDLILNSYHFFCLSACTPYAACIIRWENHKMEPKKLRHIGKVRYGKAKSPLCLSKHHAMKTYWESGGIVPRIRPRQHAPDALTPGEEPPLPTGYEVGWTPEPVWTRCRRGKFPAPVGNRTPIIQPVASRYTDWGISGLEYMYVCMYVCMYVYKYDRGQEIFRKKNYEK